MASPSHNIEGSRKVPHNHDEASEIAAAVLDRVARGEIARPTTSEEFLAACGTTLDDAGPVHHDAWHRVRGPLPKLAHRDLRRHRVRDIEPGVDRDVTEFAAGDKVFTMSVTRTRRVTATRANLRRRDHARQFIGVFVRRQPRSRGAAHRPARRRSCISRDDGDSGPPGEPGHLAGARGGAATEQAA